MCAPSLLMRCVHGEVKSRCRGRGCSWGRVSGVSWASDRRAGRSLAVYGAWLFVRAPRLCGREELVGRLHGLPSLDVEAPRFALRRIRCVEGGSRVRARSFESVWVARRVRVVPCCLLSSSRGVCTSRARGRKDGVCGYSSNLGLIAFVNKKRSLVDSGLALRCARPCVHDD